MEDDNCVLAAFVFGMFFLASVFLILNAWDHHEARHNRIECAEYNADAQSNHFPDQGPVVTIRTKACHPEVP